MSTFASQDVVCVVCGAESRQSVMMTTSYLGPPDLDFRPPMMARCDLPGEIQRCPSCSYCWSDISEGLDGIEHIVSSEAYAAILLLSDVPEKGCSYLAASHINECTGLFADATWHAIRAAWICDDQASGAVSSLLRALQRRFVSPSAVKCRETAIRLAGLARDASQDLVDAPGASNAVVVDLLRRIGNFREAAELLHRTQSSPHASEVATMLRLQMEPIERRDTRCRRLPESM